LTRPGIEPGPTRFCSLQLLLVLTSAVVLGSEFRGICDYILLSHIGDFPNLEVQVTISVSPRNRVAQLYPHVLGSVFVAFHDSQGCGGGIQTSLHTEYTLK
jgi:hypothetical protein